MKLVPTGEQDHAIATVKSNQRVKLNAFAGCSKTTTLTMIAHQLCVPSIYLAYNKGMVKEANGKFPSWTPVKTTHSLAYASYGRDLADKLKRPNGAYVNVCGTGGEIARFFALPDMRYMEGGISRSIRAAGIGRSVRETVNAFEYSADENICYKHVSRTALKDRGSVPEDFFKAYYKLVIETANKLWKLRINTQSDVLATHDTYLKLYQLSKPNLSQYQVIYLDEGQDTNECVLDIIMRQENSKIVVVGDTYQQIYQFRGSINAMDKLPFVECALTQSFRFGQPIADIANSVLSADMVTRTNLRGWDKILSKAVDSFDATAWKGCYTLLYRTNMCLVLDAVQFLGEGKKVNLEIDVKDFIKLLESAMELKQGNMNGVKHEELLAYASWSDFSEEVKDSGSELGRVHKIIAEGEFNRVIGMLKTQKNVDFPDIILTTAHKSKGREWNIVVLAGDFPSNFNEKGEWVGLNEAERNLLYVAVTRAKRLLVYNKPVSEILNREKVPVEKRNSAVEDAFDRVVKEQVRQLKEDIDLPWD